MLVDVATLTGAIKVALGQQVGGLFANDDGLADVLAESGTRAGEPLWRFPLAEVYEDKISSRIADADNAGGGPGAITAALFLQHFAGDGPWAHLDIASTGDAPGGQLRVEQGADRLRRPPPARLARQRGPAVGDRRRGVMNGLTVRWSLAGAPEGVEEALATYVAETSHARFTGKPGLQFKTWRMSSGEWFEGCYVFADDAERAAFQETFAAGAAESPGSQIIGSSPVLIEPCTIVAIAEGGSGFAAAPRAE